MTTRPDLGFGAELEQFDPAEWQAPQAKLQDRAGRAPVAIKAAEVVGFQSREPAPAAVPRKEQRRRRTGRNAQFNLKVRPETIDAFCVIADRHGWGLGETLEYAVALLERNYSKGGDD